MDSWLKYGSGNHLVELEHRHIPLDENDYARCDECGEQTHIDFIVNRTDESEVCQWCFTKMENEFFCNECCEEFLFKGIPALCPRCGSLAIWHEFTSGHILVKEKQREHLKSIAAGHACTAKILPFVPKDIRPSPPLRMLKLQQNPVASLKQDCLVYCGFIALLLLSLL